MYLPIKAAEILCEQCKSVKVISMSQTIPYGQWVANSVGMCLRHPTAILLVDTEVWFFSERKWVSWKIYMTFILPNIKNWRKNQKWLWLNKMCTSVFNALYEGIKLLAYLGVNSLQGWNPLWFEIWAIIVGEDMKVVMKNSGVPEKRSGYLFSTYHVGNKQNHKNNFWCFMIHIQKYRSKWILAIFSSFDQLKGIAMAMHMYWAKPQKHMWLPTSWNIWVFHWAGIFSRWLIRR